MKEDFGKQLTEILPGDRISRQEPLWKHTTFQIGGPADFYAEPRDEQELISLVTLARNEGVPYFLLGRGSNLLVNDLGYRGLVIHIGSSLDRVSIQETKVTAQSGILLSRLAKQLLDAELTGFEFAAGIPGSLGGAVYMNAGAYGGEMKDILVRVKALRPDGEIVVLPAESLRLSYRDSIFQHEELYILEAELVLKSGDKKLIQARMQELSEQRQEKQPLSMPSAGSVFKRPPGYYAGALISDCHLRGVRIGGAQVSEKHAGFIVNAGGATAQDVIHLIRYIQKQVEDTFHVLLKPELRILDETGLKVL